MAKSVKEEKANGSTTRSIIIIGALFFIFGFVTWLNSLLIPYLEIACELTKFQSFFVTFAFYIAYVVMAPISTRTLNKLGFKKGMSVALVIMAFGALLFIPAAITRTYLLFLTGLFIMGSGLAILQTASNPYVTIVGPAESAAKRISIMGICNKLAGAIAPILIGFFLQLEKADELQSDVANLTTAERINELNEMALRVIPPYIGIIIVLLLLALWVYKSSLPEIDTDEEDDTLSSTNASKKSVFDFPHVVLGVITLFIYVGAEVIAVDTIISYGDSLGIPLTTAKYFVTGTMVSMVVGYIIGIVSIPKYIKQENALRVSAVLGILFSIIAIFTEGYVSLAFIALLGLANSLMWPAIWPLALADVGRFTKAASSLLVMGIAGGAIIPLAYGALAENWNPQEAYWVLIPCYLFILYFAVSGYKIRRA
ncbi:sugar MFS transporter [Christiangramia forsetii]|uniref:Glucose/galactose transporter n=2 Tax=Christiangramia forsetii TaxID=411153 RepID=A0M6M3_CHRFK|nr:sugar MFS transporter [Christiangramia forsetii]GGG30034.1 glucose/galactose MFS transporter [Christiangramia forsetii]CAL68268.1 glucose/galactose transporter [Christiangramia forsetii KT0803]